MTGQFAPGARVRVRDLDRAGHVRTPHYCRDKEGLVERICGVFGNPESLAYGGDGRPEQPLYRVRFAQSELWPDYRGPAHDSVDIELYEHWLQSA